MALGHAIHQQPSADDEPLIDQVTEDLLRMLGLAPDEAARVSRIELPSVSDLLQQAMPHLERA